jgi:DNA-binding NarL/FixJ family response regulator
MGDAEQMDLAQAPAVQTAPIRVFVCDDVAGYRHFLRSALRTEAGIAVVGEAADARSCLECIELAHPEVVLLDLSMPATGTDDGDGLWAIPRIHAALPDCAIVVLSSFSEEQFGPRARAAGATHYVEKGAPISRIAGAIRHAVTL